MKLANLPVEVAFGESDGPDWKSNSKIPSPHDEDAESEDADEDDKSFVRSTLGFDVEELFQDS